MRRTLSPRCARLAARLIAVVVFPTPPFWFAMAMTFGILPFRLKRDKNSNVSRGTSTKQKTRMDYGYPCMCTHGRRPGRLKAVEAVLLSPPTILSTSSAIIEVIRVHQSPRQPRRQNRMGAGPSLISHLLFWRHDGPGPEKLVIPQKVNFPFRCPNLKIQQRKPGRIERPFIPPVKDHSHTKSSAPPLEIERILCFSVFVPRVDYDPLQFHCANIRS